MRCGQCNGRVSQDNPERLCMKCQFLRTRKTAPVATAMQYGFKIRTNADSYESAQQPDGGTLHQAIEYATAYNVRVILCDEAGWEKGVVQPSGEWRLS